MTAHRSQGQSVDAVVIAGESLNRELFYVAASRGREQVAGITSDKARLEASVGQSGARQSVSELVRTMHARFADDRSMDASRGFARGIRELVEEARRSVRVEREFQRGAVLIPSSRPSMPQVTSAAHRYRRSNEDAMMESVDNEQGWAIDHDRRPYGLLWCCRSARTCRRGRSSCTRLGPRIACMPCFSIHDVLVTGCRLEALLADVAAQVVTVVRQPSRAEAFLNTAVLRVSAVDVRRVERTVRT